MAVADHARAFGVLPEVVAVGRGNVNRLRTTAGLDPGVDLTVDDSAIADAGLNRAVTLFARWPEAERRCGHCQ